MIYTDGIHIVADTKRELRDWADAEGINRAYYHGVRKGHPHYDCPKWYKFTLDHFCHTKKIKKVRSREVLRISKLMLNTKF